MRKLDWVAVASCCALLTVAADAKVANADRPEAPGRPYGQNYKDMVLAWCVAKAYSGDKVAPDDAGSSRSALIEWTEYDIETSVDAIPGLVDRYLARDYHNPYADAEAPGLKFQFLKCLDLYHSQELQAQVKRYVPNPKRTYRQDFPPDR